MRKISTLLFCLGIFNLAQGQAIDTLLDVGKHKLHFTIIQGTGTPILFEAGNGDDESVWQSIPTEIHKKTGAPIITYDRAGLGKSEIDTNKTGLINEIKDLELGLKKLGYSKDLVIVCHSFGAYYSSLFAYRNIKKVKGVVCIDIATPCFFTKEWSEAFLKSISSEDWGMIKKYKPGLYYVLTDFTANSIYMTDKFLTDKTPATMIVAENIQPMIKEDEKEKWINCGKSFGTMRNHKYVLAKNADHKVWERNPQVVIEEILRLYTKVCTR